MVSMIELIILAAVSLFIATAGVVSDRGQASNDQIVRFLKHTREIIDDINSANRRNFELMTALPGQRDTSPPTPGRAVPEKEPIC